MSKLKELKEQRGKAHADMTIELAKEQTPEIRTAVDKFLTEIETISADIKRIERADAVAAE